MSDGQQQQDQGGGQQQAGGAQDQSQQQVAARPEWLPEAHWDAEKNSIKEDFGAHYGELAKFHQTQTEAQQALAARKPEDIKIEVKLPDTVKVPDGMQIKIDDKDPRAVWLRETAIKRGWDQDTINDVVAWDAQRQIEAHTAETQRIAAEDAKLGANGPARKTAVSNWAKGLKDGGTITADEYEEIRLTASTAAGVTLLEKIIAKANGTVPGQTPPAQPSTPAKPPLEDRMFTKRFAGNSR